jgi:GNAT superfamily N-acetyltransferase
MISKLIEYFRPRSLAPTVTTALAVGEAQARRWGQDYVGVEHLLWGLMETVPFDHSDWSLLDPLGLCWDTVRERIIEMASAPQDRLQPLILPLTPRCQQVLAIARKLARLCKSSRIEVPQVLQAMMEEAGSASYYAILGGITCVPSLSDKSPAWLSKAVETLNLSGGRAWEIPRSAVGELRKLFPSGLQNWHSQSSAELNLVLSDETFYFLGYPFGDSDDCIRVFLGPGQGDAEGDWTSFNYRKVYTEISQIVVQLASAEIARARFFAEWPVPKIDEKGALNHAFFLNKIPTGLLRPFQQQDEVSCREMYSLLEGQGLVPPGYGLDFEEWLSSDQVVRFMVEMNGHSVGCCGFTLCKEPTPRMGLASISASSSFSFGIVLPAFQNQGLGRTQLAVRLALALRDGADFCYLHATDRSRPFLERAGFKFWRSYSSEFGDILHEGSLLLTSRDTSVLEPWLSVLSVEIIETAAGLHSPSN